MAASSNFRSAFNGFNREDVVRFIEYSGNKHASEINQLKTQLATAQQELEVLRAKPAQDPALAEELALVKAALEGQKQENAALTQEAETLRGEVSDLEAKLAAAQQAQTNEELEAYRRAERAERAAGERVNQLYHQANAAVAEVSQLAAEASARADSAAKEILRDTQALISDLSASVAALEQAAQAFLTLKPAQNEV